MNRNNRIHMITMTVGPVVAIIAMALLSKAGMEPTLFNMLLVSFAVIFGMRLMLIPFEEKK